MPTGHDLISSTLRKIGALGAGEVAPGDLATQALETLNQMIAMWSTDEAAIFEETKESFTLTASQAEYTIGDSGGEDFSTTRPTVIISAFVRLGGGETDYNLEPVDEKKYAAIARKSITIYVPDYIYYDANYPTGKIFLWPVPASSDELFIYSRKVLSSLTLAGNVNLPPGYDEALIYNLGIRLGPEYGRILSPDFIDLAQDGFDMIKAANKINDHRLMRVDRALSTPRDTNYDIFTGRQ